ncbi:MAG: STAS domain-containing protein [Erysipelotrichaceae bacterium]|nr:STAS domain-containing protein [Erysipelotrichaceae bacterium]
MDSKISIKDLNEVIIFKVEGDFDNLLSLKYKNAINNIIIKKRADLYVFDLSLVNFIDSSGIGLLIGRYKQINEFEERMIICGVNQQIKKTLAISGIANIIDTYEDIYENIKESITSYE